MRKRRANPRAVALGRLRGLVWSAAKKLSTAVASIQAGFGYRAIGLGSPTMRAPVKL
jgi:hypothetical protein